MEVVVCPYSRNRSRVVSICSIVGACILNDEAVLPGDPVALSDLGELRCQLSDLRQLPRGGADTHKCGDGHAERGRVDLHAISGDHAGPLETVHSFGDRWSGHPDPACQRRHRHPRVGVQLGQ